MNPKAIRYYKKWLRRRGGTWRFWMTLWLLISAGFICLELILDSFSGNFAGAWVVPFAVILPAVALFLLCAYGGSRLGSWVLLENTERVENAGLHLQAWRELMVKHHGFIPSTVAGERFHRLLVSVTDGISRRGDLTVDQAREISELSLLARGNLARPGGVTPTPRLARFARPVAAGLFLLLMSVWLIRLLVALAGGGR